MIGKVVGAAFREDHPLITTTHVPPPHHISVPSLPWKKIIHTVHRLSFAPARPRLVLVRGPVDGRAALRHSPISRDARGIIAPALLRHPLPMCPPPGDEESEKRRVRCEGAKLLVGFV